MTIDFAPLDPFAGKAPVWNSQLMQQQFAEEDPAPENDPAPKDEAPADPAPKDDAPKPTPPPKNDPAAPAEIKDGDVDALPAWARAAIKKANTEAAAARTGKNEALKTAYEKIGRDLGLIEGDEDLTPEQMAERLREENESKGQTITELTGKLAAVTRRDAIADAAKLHDGDATLLVPFLNGTQEFVSLNVNDEDYAAQVAAVVADVIQKNPKLKATQVAPRGGGDAIPSGEPSSGELTIEQRREARQKRRGL